MGVFSRMRDIVNSNFNAMLEKAEDPEKLIKMMIMEMEDTLVQIKSSAASVMANKKQAERALAASYDRAESWEQRAQLAIDRGREDLAREALLEKRHFLNRARAQETELPEFDVLVDRYKNDIQQLEEKLTEAREKHRVLVQRYVHANGKKQVHQQIRKADSYDAFVRFENLEQRIDRVEAEAELVDYGRKPNLEDQFAALQEDEEIEKEIAAMKSASGKAPVEKEKATKTKQGS